MDLASGGCCLRAIGRLLLMVTLLELTPASVLAHHPKAVFDHSKPVVVEGVVREFRWTSPHAWLLLAVARDAPTGGAGADGTEQWALEGASLAVMVRNGWKSNSLRAGDRVRVLVAPRRDGAPGGEFLGVTLTESGKVLRIGPN
jgi:Family of unknown function (DUF6152)